MDQAMLLAQEPCENKTTNFPSGELRVWCLSPWIQSTRQQWRGLYMTCEWHRDKQVPTETPKIIVSEEQGSWAGPARSWHEVQGCNGRLGVLAPTEMVRKRKKPLQC